MPLLPSTKRSEERAVDAKSAINRACICLHCYYSEFPEQITLNRTLFFWFHTLLYLVFVSDFSDVLMF